MSTYMIPTRASDRNAAGIRMLVQSFNGLIFRAFPSLPALHASAAATLFSSVSTSSVLRWQAAHLHSLDAFLVDVDV